MYQTNTGSYDEIPEGMKKYINNYGCHFNKKLCNEAAKRMYKRVDGSKEYIKPYTKEQINNLLESENIKLDRDVLYDKVYVANMCKADFLGSSVPKEDKYLALFIKDMVDDPDAPEGYIFNRFYSDTVFSNSPVDWDEML